MYFLTLMSFALNRSELFSQQVLYYHTDSQNPGGRGYPTSYSSNRYSPKSHTAVKKITSKAIRKASQSQRSAGFSANSAAVASVLAISSDSTGVGSNVKLNSTTTIKIKTTVVVNSSRERNSVRSSLPSSTEVLENRLIYALAKVRIERRLAPFCVSATTVPASRRIPRVASAEISDSPCRLIKIVEPAPWRRHNVSANQLAPWGSSPVDGSSSSNTDGSCSRARAMATRWRIPRENVRTKESRRSNKPTSCSNDSTRLAGSGIPSNRANSNRFSSAVSSS